MRGLYLVLLLAAVLSGCVHARYDINTIVSLGDYFYTSTYFEMEEIASSAGNYYWYWDGNGSWYWYSTGGYTGKWLLAGGVVPVVYYATTNFNEVNPCGAANFYVYSPEHPYWTAPDFCGTLSGALTLYFDEVIAFHPARYPGWNVPDGIGTRTIERMTEDGVTIKYVEITNHNDTPFTGPMTSVYYPEGDPNNGGWYYPSWATWNPSTSPYRAATDNNGLIFIEGDRTYFNGDPYGSIVFAVAGVRSNTYHNVDSLYDLYHVYASMTIDLQPGESAGVLNIFAACASPSERCDDLVSTLNDECALIERGYLDFLSESQLLEVVNFNFAPCLQSTPTPTITRTPQVTPSSSRVASVTPSRTQTVSRSREAVDFYRDSSSSSEKSVVLSIALVLSSVIAVLII